MRQRGGSGLVNTRIADRESDYQRQRIKRMLSPEVGCIHGILRIREAILTRIANQFVVTRGESCIQTDSGEATRRARTSSVYDGNLS